MAARFWVGGTGNWDGVDTTHWSTTSGGSGGASAPGASDDVTFDGSSGGGTVTITADPTVLSITGGAFTGTLDFGTGRTVSIGTGGFNFSGTGTRTITLGNALITSAATSNNAFDINTSTNLTVTANTSTITLTAAGASIRLPALNMNGASIVMSGSGTATVNGAGGTTTVANFTRTGTAVKTDILSLAVALTCTGTFTCNGNSAINRVLVSSNTVGTARTITAATVSVNAADFQDITGAGAGSWNLSGAANYSGDCGGNTNITFTTAATQTATGTSSFNWSTHGWTSRVPLPQDNVVVGNSFSASQFIGCDMPRLGRSIDFSGATGSVDLRLGSTANSIFGSLTLGAGLTVSGVNTLTFAGRGNFTITSAGKSFTQGLTFAMPTGTYTLQDALSHAGSFTFNNGTFNTGGFSISSGAMTTSGSSITKVWIGSTNWTFTATATGILFQTYSGLSGDMSGVNIIVGAASANTRTIGPVVVTTLGTLTYTVAGSTGELDITGSNSFAQINFSDASNARSLKFTAGTTTTIRNPNGFNVFGTTGKNMTVDSITAANHTLTSSSQQAGNIDYLTLGHSVVDASPKWYAGANSTDGGTNTNWLFSAYSSVTNPFVAGRSAQEQEYAFYASQLNALGISTTGMSLSQVKLTFFNNKSGANIMSVDNAELVFLKKKTGKYSTDSRYDLWLSYLLSLGIAYNGNINDMKRAYWGGTTV